MLAEAEPMLAKDLDADVPRSEGRARARCCAVLLTSAGRDSEDPAADAAAARHRGEGGAHAAEATTASREGLDDAAWNTRERQLQNAAKAALLYIAVVPGSNALAKNDCETAQSRLQQGAQRLSGQCVHRVPARAGIPLHA